MKLSRRQWPWLVLVLAILAVPLPAASAAPVDRTIRVEASRFQYSPGVIRVNPGDRVTVELVSKDVVHGLSIDGYNLSVTADPGQTARLTFVASQSGSFRFRCSATCGNMHPFMVGKLQVGQNSLFLRGTALAVLSLFAGLWSLRK